MAKLKDFLEEISVEGQANANDLLITLTKQIHAEAENIAREHVRTEYEYSR